MHKKPFSRHSLSFYARLPLCTIHLFKSIKYITLCALCAPNTHIIGEVGVTDGTTTVCTKTNNQLSHSKKTHFEIHCRSPPISICHINQRPMMVGGLRPLQLWHTPVSRYKPPNQPRYRLSFFVFTKSTPNYTTSACWKLDLYVDQHTF